MSEIICSCCGSIIDDENYYEVEDSVICDDCYRNRTFTCDCCGERYFDGHDYGDENITAVRAAAILSMTMMFAGTVTIHIVRHVMKILQTSL